MNLRRPTRVLGDIAMTPSQAALIDHLRDRIGPKAITTERDAIAPWETDWRGRWHGHAPALLSPGSTQEVATIVAAARARGVALVPQGGNTSMVGGATPPEDGSPLIVSLRRMNRLRGIEPHANLARRTEERRVGKERVSTCRYRWEPN